MRVFWKISHISINSEALPPIASFFEFLNYNIRSNAVSARAEIEQGTRF